MANEIITTLHPDQDPNTNLYPNIKKENIPNKSIDEDKLTDELRNKLANAIANISQPKFVTTLPTTDQGLVVYTDGYLYSWDNNQYVNTNISYQQNTTIPDKSITGDKLDLLSISNLHNNAIDNCGNITGTGTAWRDYFYNTINLEQDKIYFNCCMFKKNENHTDTAQVGTNIRSGGVPYTNITTLAYQYVTLTNEYQFVYRLFRANENKQNVGVYYYRNSPYAQETIIDMEIKSMFLCEFNENISIEDFLNDYKNYNYLLNYDYLSQNIYSLKEEIENDVIDEITPLLNVPDDKTILCYGDSLTAGAGGNGTTYPNVLQALLGGNYVVSNRGVGGENALQIGCRQGGIQAFIDPIEIPTSYVPFDYKSIIKDISLNPIGLQSSASNTINPVKVDGHECTIYFTSNTQSIIKSDDVSFNITHPTPLLPKSSNDVNKTLILWVGQNGWGSTNNEDLINIIKNMIAYNGNNNYLVIGLSSGNDETRTELDDLMMYNFGNHFINIRKYLVNYGLSDNNITPKSQDLIDISNGVVPTSLRSDGVHLNSYGYTSVGNCIYRYGKNNKLW